MSMFNDIEWTQKGNTETCLHSANKVSTCATQFKPGHWCFPGSCQKLRGGTERKFPRTSGTIELSRCRWLTPSSVTLPTRYFQQQSHHRLDGERRDKITTSDNKKLFIKAVLASNLLCVFAIECASGIRLKIRHLHLEERETKSKSISIDYAKAVNTDTKARSDSLLQLAENHETLIRKASEQAACVRMVTSGLRSMIPNSSGRTRRHNYL